MFLFEENRSRHLLLPGGGDKDLPAVVVMSRFRPSVQGGDTCSA
jgi:hypothetical protein